MNQLISIIIPVYNVATYLERCLNSITNQTCRNLEIILINDGSTDQSGQICDIWASKDARIKVLHTTNQGVAAARNCGLHVARGEFIGFADPDDWAEPDLFEKLADALEQFNADIAICGFEEQWPDHSVFKVSKRGRCFTKEEALSELIRDLDMQSYLWNKMFRRRCVPDTPFPKLKWMSDLGGLHNFFRNATTIVEINQPLYHYVRRNDSLVGIDGPLEMTVDYCIAQQVRYADLVSESHKIRRTMQKKYMTTVISVMNAFAREYKRKNDDKKAIVKIKTIIYPFYSLHLPEFKSNYHLVKSEEISDFLRDPENYDFANFRKRYYMLKIIEKLMAFLHVFKV